MFLGKFIVSRKNLSSFQSYALNTTEEVKNTPPPRSNRADMVELIIFFYKSEVIDYGKSYSPPQRLEGNKSIVFIDGSSCVCCCCA